MGSMLALADLFHIYKVLCRSQKWTPVVIIGSVFADEICIRSLEPNGFNDEGDKPKKQLRTITPSKNAT
jgi:hypothetical protein